MSTLQSVSPGRSSSFRETRQRPTCFLVGSIWDLPLPLDPSTQTLFLPFSTNILSTSVCLTICKFQSSQLLQGIPLESSAYA